MNPLNWLSTSLSCFLPKKNKTKTNETYDVFMQKQKEIDAQYQSNLHAFNTDLLRKRSWTDESSF